MLIAPSPNHLNPTKPPLTASSILAPLPAVAQRRELYDREADLTNAALEFEIAEQKV